MRRARAGGGLGGGRHAWALATGAPGAQAAELAQRAEAALIEAVGLRDSLQSRQREVAQMEREAVAIRSLATSIVPGLLQTAEYARHIFGNITVDAAEVSAAVAARLDRQSILYEDGRSFELLLSEAMLRALPGPRPLAMAQLDRLRSVLTLPSVRIGIIPLGAFGWAWHDHGFTVLEGRDEGEGIVHVETLTAVVHVTDPAGVRAYRSAFERLSALAVDGEEAGSWIDRLIRERGGAQ